MDPQPVITMSQEAFEQLKTALDEPARSYRRPERDLTHEEGKRLESILNSPPRPPSREMLEAGEAFKGFMAGE